MIFTIGCFMMMIGFAIGTLFGESNVRLWNKYDYIGAIVFNFGVIGVLSSFFTITWRYMP